MLSTHHTVQGLEPRCSEEGLHVEPMLNEEADKVESVRYKGLFHGMLQIFCGESEYFHCNANGQGQCMYIR